MKVEVGRKVCSDTDRLSRTQAAGCRVNTALEQVADVRLRISPVRRCGSTWVAQV